MQIDSFNSLISQPQKSSHQTPAGVQTQTALPTLKTEVAAKLPPQPVKDTVESSTKKEGSFLEKHWQKVGIVSGLVLGGATVLYKLKKGKSSGGSETLTTKVEDLVKHEAKKDAEKVIDAVENKVSEVIPKVTHNIFGESKLEPGEKTIAHVENILSGLDLDKKIERFMKPSQDAPRKVSQELEVEMNQFLYEVTKAIKDVRAVSSKHEEALLPLKKTAHEIKQQLIEASVNRTISMG